MIRLTEVGFDIGTCAIKNLKGFMILSGARRSTFEREENLWQEDVVQELGSYDKG